MHSGAVCPGLIEASVWIADSQDLEIGIPGQSAPASLKPTELVGSAESPLSHSGAVCPGLIEAASYSATTNP